MEGGDIKISRNPCEQDVLVSKPNNGLVMSQRVIKVPPQIKYVLMWLGPPFLRAKFSLHQSLPPTECPNLELTLSISGLTLRISTLQTVIFAFLAQLLANRNGNGPIGRVILWFAFVSFFGSGQTRGRPQNGLNRQLTLPSERAGDDRIRAVCCQTPYATARFHLQYLTEGGLLTV